MRLKVIFLNLKVGYKFVKTYESFENFVSLMVL